ncbi:TPM domain-containing protein [Leptonema illini]|uniref:TPM domain-containing protein n=1 Tax=Leptonema illini DSM 21528 TaxID=929563 RepID=H2CFN2_9LEPT|nr:TPM domain-containing protein [Leptonema illini]EHQ05697.1 protein of unknown function DUF477 [Leptonema illini DSM 21528]
MKRFTIRSLLFYALLATGLLSTDVLFAAPLPEFGGVITDTASMLPEADRSRIATKIRELRERKGSQIFVVTIPTLDDETIEDFSQRLFEAWRPGRKEVDDGVLFVIAKNDRKMRIHTGYGLEGAIPDAFAKQILADTVRPLFKEERYAEGIEAGVDRLIGVIDGEELPPADAGEEEPDDSLIAIILWLILGALNLPGILSGFFSREEGGRLAGKWLLGLTAILWLPAVPVMLLGWQLPDFWLTLYFVVCLLLLAANGLFFLGSLISRFAKGGGSGSYNSSSSSSSYDSSPSSDSSSSYDSYESSSSYDSSSSSDSSSSDSGHILTQK